MGEVRLARDTVLDRDVAIKTPRFAADDRALLAEARVTARLEHPGILPIYDAGRLPDGAAYYATRVFSGRSLAEALDEARDLPSRLRLMRHLLTVAQALAYAHAAGVMHRDLKPANVMIGAYGDTVVADWGLATPIAGAVSNRSGTPGFIAPEAQVEGPIDARVDVYALGAMLHLLVCGAMPGEAPTIESPPPELVAIAVAATAPRDQRYASMSELATDLEAWLDGRRVTVHAYSAAELARRLVQRWRAPLTVAALSFVLIAGAITAGWWRTLVERDRALLAEADATRARNLAQAHLAEALVGEARLAADDDRRTEAEALAVQALQLGPSPEARGVLARFGGRERPIAIQHGAMPNCLGAAVSANGELAACQQAGTVQLIDVRGTPTVMRTLSSRATTAIVAADGKTVFAYVPDDALVAWGASDVPGITRIGTPAIVTFGRGARSQDASFVLSGRVGFVRSDAAGLPQMEMYPACLTPSAITAISPTEVVVACIGGELLRVGPGHPPTLLTRLVPAGPSAVSSAAGRIAAGTMDGEVVLLDHAGHVERRFHLGRSAVRILALHERYVAAVLEEGTLAVVDSRTGAMVLRVYAPQSDLAWLPGTATLRVVGAEVTDWQLPDAIEPHRITLQEGVSALAVDPAGAWVLAGTGDANLRGFRLADGAPLAVQPAPPFNVVKDLSPSPDGAYVAVAVAASVAQSVLRVADWSVAGTWHDHGLRRASYVGETLISVAYAHQVLVSERAGDAWQTRVALDADAWDADASASHAAVLTTSGEVWQVDPSGATRLFATIAGTRAVATLGEDIVTVGPDGARRVRSDGVISSPWPLLGDPVEVVAAHHLRWVAVGMIEGPVQILDATTGATLAVLRGHTGRVALVRLTSDDAWLVTGSWDHDLRVWYTADLELPVEDVLGKVGWEPPISR